MSSLAALALHATGLEFNWTGGGEDGNALDNLNWLEGTLVSSSTTDLTFGAPSPSGQFVIIPGSFEVNHLTFPGTTDPVRPAYTFTGVDSPTVLVHGSVDVGAGGAVTFDSSLSLSLSGGAHTVNVADGATTVSVLSNIGESDGIASLTKTGDGKLVLSGIDSYSGGTSVAGGTLEVATAGALGSGTDVNVSDGATFAVSADQTIRALTGEGEVDIGADRTLTVNLPLSGDGSSALFGGSINGDGIFVKDGPGYLTLTGNSAYSGGTFVNTGTLEIAGGSISHPDADFLVGDAGSGMLAITGGGSASVRNAVVGRDSYGLIQVSGSGLEVPSRLEVHGDLTLGDEGPQNGNALGSLTISEGGRVTVDGTSYLGAGGNAASSGSVSGEGSTWKSADVIVGVAGSASLWVQDGGQFAVTCDTLIGQDVSSSGSIFVTDAGSSLHTTKMVAGVSGFGSLTLLGGATATIGGGEGTLVLGQGATGSGTLNIGDGSSAAPGVLNAAAVTTGAGSGLIVFATQATSDAPDYFTRDGTASGAAIAIGGNTSVWSWSGAHVLAGDNTYTGPTYVFGGTMIGGSDTAFGTGHVFLSSNATVELDSAAPTLGGLSSSLTYTVTGGGNDNTQAGALPVSSSLILSRAVERLTISPSADDHDDTFAGVISGIDGTVSSAMLIKSGDGQFNLAGANLYSGGTEVRSGVLVVSNSSSALNGDHAIISGPLGTGAVAVHGGGALGLDYGVTLANPVTLAGSSDGYAAIGGFGTLAPVDQALLVGRDAAISPGAKLAINRTRDSGSDVPPVGTFFIGNTTLPTSVTFAGGSGYDWGVQDIALADGTGSDLIAITGTLTFNVDVGEVFTFRITSFDASGDQGVLADFAATQPREWVVLTATGGITGFDPTRISFNVSGFLNSPNDFMFSLDQRAFGANGGELVLTFNPAAVPEPSTWALLLTGLALAGTLSLRRRRA